jgi:hypothetical protein
MAATCRTAPRSTTAADWRAVHYGVDPSTGRIDYDHLLKPTELRGHAPRC